ncbi:MAG: ATP-binding cassette domain-containing protein [Pseudomonadales bacterium]|nr:ATP-binding cassette domain-containing protein [Pseudomonadales bacterium]
MIDVAGLSKRFGEVTAVKDVSFEAQDGRVTGLLGPNGAGKSTTLRILYGLLRPDAGRVRVDGVDVVADPRGAQRHIGVLPDNHGLYPRLTAREHILYFGRLQGVAEDKLGERADELIRLLDMSGIADRRTEGFSQGERMKVCLARAMVHDPRNIILDEPTNGLDVMTTRRVRELIGELRRRGIAVLFSSHLMHEVARLCDHIVIISEGIVVAAGTTESISEAAGEPNLEDAFVKLVETVLP